MMKVLIVEDAKSVSDMIAKTLKTRGFSVLQAFSAEDALDCVKNLGYPDLILLDVVLPNMSGLEFAKEIRRLETKNDWTPIIFLTGRREDKDVEDGIYAGGDDYLTKPVSEAVMLAKIMALKRLLDMKRQLVAMNVELSKLSLLDPLTGTANRRRFDDACHQEWSRCRRQKTNLSLLMCDIDFFKRVNDDRGHVAGDDVLLRVAQTISASIRRPSDLLARYGGEEFAVLLPDTDLEGACKVAESVRRAVFEEGMSHSDGTPITISVGVSSVSPFFVENDWKNGVTSLVESADSYLYLAKSSGRNRACSALGGACVSV